MEMMYLKVYGAPVVACENWNSGGRNGNVFLRLIRDYWDLMNFHSSLSPSSVAVLCSTVAVGKIFYYNLQQVLFDKKKEQNYIRVATVF